MTSSTIDALLAGLNRYGNRPALGEKPATCADDPVVKRFAANYGKSDIGWDLARDYAREKRGLPVTLLGDDQWIHRAMMYLRFGHPDKSVGTAWFLGTSKRNDIQQAAHVIRALLLVENATLGDVSRVLRVDRSIIAAFERLFFNVLSRRDDVLYIRSIVYPDGRLVELYDNYLKEEPLGRILMRAGWNNGQDDVLFLAGLRKPELLHKMANSQDMVKKLEGLYIANGMITARNGWLNQSTHAKGLNDAKTLIAAAKAGGIQLEDSNPMRKVGEVLDAELRAAATTIRREHAEAKITAFIGANQ